MKYYRSYRIINGSDKRIVDYVIGFVGCYSDSFSALEVMNDDTRNNAKELLKSYKIRTCDLCEWTEAENKIDSDRKNLEKNVYRIDIKLMFDAEKYTSKWETIYDWGNNGEYTYLTFYKNGYVYFILDLEHKDNIMYLQDEDADSRLNDMKEVGLLFDYLGRISQEDLFKMEYKI